MSTDNGGEFRAAPFTGAVTGAGGKHRFIRAGRPQTNGCGERVHHTILEECWRAVLRCSICILNCFVYLHGHSVGGTNPSLVRALGCGNCIAAYSSPYNLEVLGAGAEICGETFRSAAELAEALGLRMSYWRDSLFAVPMVSLDTSSR